MKLQHWMKREVSGLAFTTLELAQAEEQAGHKVCISEPSGNVLYGSPLGNPDVELIHSQYPVQNYHNGKPRFMWMHGEPISSVGNGVSMKAIIDLAPLCDAFIAMRAEEMDYWSAIKRTYRVPKGIDLDAFRPLPLTEAGEKLSGAPSVLYIEHWRGQRNPLPLVMAMLRVHKEYPEARLHLYNCTDKRMMETFQELVKHGKLWPFVRSLQGPVKPAEVNQLLNRCDIVVSCLYPFYARTIEALGAGRGFLCPGYTAPEYPWHCTLDPADMARAIIDLWENGCGQFDFRGYAEQHHDVQDTVRQSVSIYERYLEKEPNHVREPEPRQPAPREATPDREPCHCDRGEVGPDRETQGRSECRAAGKRLVEAGVGQNGRVSNLSQLGALGRNDD
jgi:glycosyltransferase involved in cell wall biosynthesis